MAYKTAHRIKICFSLFATLRKDLPPILFCFPYSLVLYSPPYFPSLFLPKAQGIFTAVTRFLPPAYCSIIPRLLKKRQKTGLHSRLAEYLLPDPKYHSIHCPYYFPPLCYFDCVMNNSPSLSLHSAILLQLQPTTSHLTIIAACSFLHDVHYFLCMHKFT